MTDGYISYKVIIAPADPTKLTELLKELALQRWRVVCAVHEDRLVLEKRIP